MERRKNWKTKTSFDHSKRKQSVRKIEAKRRRKNDVNEETLTNLEEGLREK